ncbi:MAG: type II toxin-antitoxin system RelB/DinJ family antitoxin [Clostridia bacterium]|nr:type II toxin-antitoxin system RelB/DinJ family antitoxin [Clostridia bacterium]
MATTPTQIRIDSNVKKAAADLFDSLGLDMSSAVNIFLYQCVLHGGLPFAVELPKYSQKTLDAMAEAKRISSDSSVPGYSSMEELKEALES